jgi:hypothetical protein
MKEEIDLAEATEGEEAAMAVAEEDMGEVEEGEEAMVVEVDTAAEEDTIGAVGIAAMNEIVAQFPSKKAKRSKLRLNPSGAEETA